MEEIYCSYEQAKKLKELGFPQDIQTLYFYTKPNSKMYGIDEHYRFYNIKNTPKKLYAIGEYAVKHKENAFIAPTISLAYKWLLSKKKLFISVVPSMTDGTYDLKIFKIVKRNGIIHHILKNQKDGFKSILDAYTIGLDLCLTLISTKR